MSEAAVLKGLASEMEELVREGRWSEACDFYERLLVPEERQEPANRLSYAIALIRSGKAVRGVNLIDAEVARLPQARSALRRHIIPQLIGEKRLEAAVAVLSALIAADPASVEDLRLRGSLLGRSRQFAPAIDDARRVIQLQPADLPGHTSYLQLLLQDGRLAEAGEHALTLGDMAADNPRLASIVFLAFERAGLHQQAADFADIAGSLWVGNADVAAAVMRAYLNIGAVERTIDAGERCIAAGAKSADVLRMLGQAYRDSERPDGMERTIAHLNSAVQLLPGDANSRLLLGETLMRCGRSAEALPHLQAACKALPQQPNARALLARAYKQNGQAGEAAREFRRLLELQPGSQRWHRFAAGALSQAGHRAEAVELFDAFTARRAQALPQSFEQGLEALWDQVDTAHIPQARLDWAWQLQRQPAEDRAAWERAARWGHLADHYMLDWLECRDELAHEAMGRLADLSEAERGFAEVDGSRGLILASAHIGAMYAGPLALELLGVRAKWLASTPGVARTAYARSLISTSDQSGTDVARHVLGALNGANAVVIAVDGAINLAAPRIPFEGQEITYSSFASRMAHRLKIPSMFVAPYWQGGQIHFEMKRLPDAENGESAEEHAERWQTAFLAHLRNFLAGAPENLRLSGGLWRHIRPSRSDRD